MLAGATTVSPIADDSFTFMDLQYTTDISRETGRVEIALETQKGDIMGRFTQGNIHRDVRLVAPKGFYLSCDDYAVGTFPGSYAFATADVAAQWGGEGITCYWNAQIPWEVAFRMDKDDVME